MPVLPDGSWVDDEQYAEMLARTGGSGIPTSGHDLGTNWSFAPATTGGGTLNLGWNAAPNLSADINFDPSAGYENAFISDYDIAGVGMANVGDISSPDANLSLTAGLQGQGLSTPDPYIQAAVENVVPGFNVATGTNIPSSATFSTGNLEDQGYSLDLSKVSGGPTQFGFTQTISPGVNLNLGTGQGGNIGVTASGAWEDAGKIARQFLGKLNPISDAGASGEVPAVGTQPLGKYGPGGYMGDPLGAGMAEIEVPSTIPSTRTTQSTTRFGPSGWTGDPQNHPDTVQFESTTPTDAQIEDVMRHGGLTFGVPVDTGQYTDIGTHGWVPQWYREFVRDRRDTIDEFLGDETTTDKLQDLINNQIAADMLRLDPTASRQDLFDQFMDNPNVVYDQDSLNAMVDLAKKGYYEDEAQVQEAINEVKTGVDSFKELSVPSAPTVTTPTRSVAIPAAVTAVSGPTHVPAAPAKPAGPTKAELQAAAAAQRKADLAAQKAAARRTALARQALKDSQAAATRAAAASAAQAKAAQKAAKAVLARMSNDRNTPSQREINAAIEVMSQVDTFGSGGMRNSRGEVGMDETGYTDSSGYGVG